MCCGEFSPLAVLVSGRWAVWRGCPASWTLRKIGVVLLIVPFSYVAYRVVGGRLAVVCLSKLCREGRESQNTRENWIRSRARVLCDPFVLLGRVVCLPAAQLGGQVVPIGRFHQQKERLSFCSGAGVVKMWCATDALDQAIARYFGV